MPAQAVSRRPQGGCAESKATNVAGEGLGDQEISCANCFTLGAIGPSGVSGCYVVSLNPPACCDPLALNQKHGSNGLTIMEWPDCLTHASSIVIIEKALGMQGMETPHWAQSAPCNQLKGKSCLVVCDPAFLCYKGLPSVMWCHHMIKSALGMARGTEPRRHAPPCVKVRPPKEKLLVRIYADTMRNDTQGAVKGKVQAIATRQSCHDLGDSAWNTHLARPQGCQVSIQSGGSVKLCARLKRLASGCCCSGCIKARLCHSPWSATWLTSPGSVTWLTSGPVPRPAHLAFPGA